nr:unnamed protein product [Callosobruchus chinensis]
MNVVIIDYQRKPLLCLVIALFDRARKYFSPSNLLTLYKAHIRPSLQYCSHIWRAAAPTTLSILDAVQKRAIRVIGRWFFIQQELNDTTTPLFPGSPEPGMDCLVMYWLSLRVLAYSSPASTNFP